MKKEGPGTYGRGTPPDIGTDRGRHSWESSVEIRDPTMNTY